MKTNWLGWTAVLITMLAIGAKGTVHYVDVNGANPAPPYTNWSTAATTIQAAIDAADSGDSILVTNGIYQTGGKAVYNSMSNRVAICQAIAVQSVNGPEVTVIQGYQVPGTIYGAEAVRCAYLTNGASLTGFTLANGATHKAGDGTTEESGGGVWCEGTNALVTDCLFVGNVAFSLGGGSYQGSFASCIFRTNAALLGGATYRCWLTNCELTANAATSGGAADAGTLINCLIRCNQAAVGAATYGCTQYNCTITGNAASLQASAAYGGILNNCTIIGNLPALFSGACAVSSLNNCIIYFNGNGNYSGGTLNYCCTIPLPGSGTGNISCDPQLASLTRLSADSPCRGAGDYSYVYGTDFDGETWGNPPSIGSDEYVPASITGPLTVAFEETSTNVIPGFVVNLTAAIEGRASVSRWDFGDGTVVSNAPYASHSWAAPGDYLVDLSAWNETYPAGVSASVVFHVVTDPHIRYVAADTSNPMPPYLSWANAASQIQDAVDLAAPGDLVLVTNGIYQTGGRRGPFPTTQCFNRVSVTNPITVQSVQGPALTIIQGIVPGGTNHLIRCVYLASGAVLTGFTATNGSATPPPSQSYPDSDLSGGGIYCQSASAIVSNCVIVGNTGASFGGGVFSGTLNNCLLTSNAIVAGGGFANIGGGGAHSSVLNDCTLAGNSSLGDGGGALLSTLSHCTLANNSASGGGGAANCSLSYCTIAGNAAHATTFVGGGGVYEIGTYQIISCMFSNNTAYDGGGLFASVSYAGSIVSNCTFTGNQALHFGGAAYGAPLDRCTLAGNFAGQGGGAMQCVLRNCLIVGNTATNRGGGSALGNLTNCTVAGNAATNSGGGCYGDSPLRNCIVYFNAAPTGSNIASASGISYSCTAPIPPGFGAANNITNAPLFVDQSAGDFRLQPTSPCINAGYNGFVVTSLDLDGNPRIAGGTVDIGAYEFQSPTSLLSYAWLQQYGLPLDGSVDFAELDGDGMNNWQEWRAATNPTNSMSVLRMLTLSNSVSGVSVSWQSVPGRQYFLERSTDLAAQPPFFTVQSNIQASLSSSTAFLDTNATGNGPVFYRVGVQP